MKIARPASVLAVIALAVGLSACSGTPEAATSPSGTGTVAVAAIPSGHVDAEAFMAAADNEAVTIVDVRTPAEYAAGHLDGAVNIDVESADFPARIAELDADGTYALYCRSANRSRVAEQVMREAGFRQIFALEGGVSAIDPSMLVTD